MTKEFETRKIMTKPLPQILDEIEDSIRLSNEAAKSARTLWGPSESVNVLTMCCWSKYA